MTLETGYGVPTVAVHTDKFDRVVRSVATVNGSVRVSTTGRALASTVNGSRENPSIPSARWALGSCIRALCPTRSKFV